MRDQLRNNENFRPIAYPKKILYQKNRTVSVRDISKKISYHKAIIRKLPHADLIILPSF